MAKLSLSLLKVIFLYEYMIGLKSKSFIILLGSYELGVGDRTKILYHDMTNFISR